MQDGDIEIKWHSIGTACKAYALAFGVAFLALVILNLHPQYRSLADSFPWIPKYISDILAFAVTMAMIWRVSKGRLADYGFTLTGRNLHLASSLFVGAAFAVICILCNHLFQNTIQNLDTQAVYSKTVVNTAGMFLFQWVFVGLLEEPLARGLVQTRLRNESRGTIRLIKWDFHIATVVAGILFGTGHIVPHLFFENRHHFWLSKLFSRPCLAYLRVRHIRKQAAWREPFRCTTSLMV